MISQSCLYCQCVQKKCLCDSCFERIPRDTYQVRSRPHLKSVLSLVSFHHPVVKTLMHAVKFRQNDEAAKVLSRLFWRTLSELPQSLSVLFSMPLPYFWLPIPSHVSREKERGATVLDWLTQTSIDRLNIPYYPSLERLKRTRRFFGLSKCDRKAEITGAFFIQPDLSLAYLRDRQVYLVDDILTTGATLEEAAKAIASHVSWPVRAITLCYA